MIRVILGVLLLVALVFFGGRWMQSQGLPNGQPTAVGGNAILQAVMPGAPAADAPSDESCRSQEWLNEVLAAGTDVSALIGQLDRDFRTSDGATWSQPGYSIPANSLVWTDWLPEGGVPSQVREVRAQGTWGVWYSETSLDVPSPNGGGRYTQLCQGVTVPVSASSDPYQTGQQSAAPAASNTSTATCITSDKAAEIAGNSDPVTAYNAFFEETGFAFGGNLDAGQAVPIAAFFLGSQPEPANSATQLGGPTWITSGPSIAKEGGRWMQFCISTDATAAAPSASPPASDPPGQ